MKETLHIRPETPSDTKAITKINDLAFGRKNESVLISTLRSNAAFDPRLSLVALKSGELIGHIFLFPIFIQTEQENYPSLSLGPIAVHPEHQNQGVGGRLISQGHEAALKVGYTSVILVGHPWYYPKFGYRMASIWGLTNPWGIHNEAFMAIELVKGSLEGKSGLAKYPEEFNNAT